MQRSSGMSRTVLLCVGSHSLNEKRNSLISQLCEILGWKERRANDRSGHGWSFVKEYEGGRALMHVRNLLCIYQVFTCFVPLV